jgi:hypothetical protein
MSESEDVENFGRGLESLLAGRAAAPRPDAPALEAARRLLAVDFSAQSRVRAGLRARLLARRDGSRSRFSPAALAAACLLLALAPLLTRLARRPPPAPVAFQREGRRMTFELPPIPAAPKTRFPRGKEGLPVLPGRLAPEPADVAAAELVFATARGREVALKDGKAVVWQIEGDSYRLESRAVAPEQIFAKPHFRGVL